MKFILYLGLLQTLYYSAFYYLFPAVLPYVLSSSDWTELQFNSGFSLVLVVSGLCAPYFGSLVDRGRGVRLIALAGILGGIGVILIPLSRNIAGFYAAAVLIGIASAMGQYEVCFAYLVRRFPQSASRKIITVTIMAGFASSITFPFIRSMVVYMSWQAGVYLLGALAMAAGLLLLLRTKYVPPQQQCEQKLRPQPHTDSTPRASRIGGYIITVLLLLTVSRVFTLVGIKIMHTQILPVMHYLDFSQNRAVLLASSVGPMQVAGRLLLFLVLRRRDISPLVTNFAALSAITAAAGLLIAAAYIPVFVIGFVVLQGMAAGVLSILNPLVTVRFFGEKHIGKFTGISALGTKLFAAAAPVFSSLIIQAGNIRTIPLTLVILSGSGILFFGLAVLMHRRKALTPADNASS